MNRVVFFLVLGLLLPLWACHAPEEAPVVEASPTATLTPSPFAVPTPVPTPTPTPTATPTPSPSPTPSGLLGGRFLGFSYEGPVIRESEYRSQNLCITVYHASDADTYKGFIDYHVADIHLQDVTLFRTGCAGGSFTSQETAQVLDMARRYGAILATSGDYCSVNNGIVVRNGVVYQAQKPSRDVCLLYRDGSMETLTKNDYISAEELLSRDVWQAFNFGPGLLDENGQAKKELYLGVNANKNNPRCLLGYYEPGHYALVLIDGRQIHRSRGLDIGDLAKFAQNMGFTAAFNLDGGNSAVMVWQGQIYNTPSSPGGRSISDILYFAPEEGPFEPASPAA